MAHIEQRRLDSYIHKLIRISKDIYTYIYLLYKNKVKAILAFGASQAFGLFSTPGQPRDSMLVVASWTDFLPGPFSDPVSALFWLRFAFVFVTVCITFPNVFFASV